MDINALTSIPLNALNAATSSTGESIGLAMLDKQLEMSDTMNAQMIRAMEQSVNPSVGSSFDVRI